MCSITLAYMKELLYLIGVKFDRLPLGTRITLALCYVSITIGCATLNGIYLYVFLTKPKLRTPSNLIMSSLLWNNILLLLTVLPLTLLETCIDNIAKNQNVISVQTYITLSDAWLSFNSIVHIAINRVQKIRRGLVNFDECEYRNIILFVLGAIFSVSMPLLTVITYFYFGMKATTIFSLVKFIMVTFILSISYVAIVLMVKRSKNRLESLQENHHLLRQQERTLKKVKKTVGLVIGGYILALLPIICCYATEIYSFYYKDFPKENEVFMYTFRSVTEMILYMNSVFNAIIYFHRNTEFREEVGKLYIIKHTYTIKKSLKFCHSNI